MRRIGELHLDYPFAGSRMLRGLLKAEGHEVGRLHVATLMKKMGVEALYRRPKLYGGGFSRPDQHGEQTPAIFLLNIRMLHG